MVYNTFCHKMQTVEDDGMQPLTNVLIFLSLILVVPSMYISIDDYLLRNEQNTVIKEDNCSITIEHNLIEGYKCFLTSVSQSYKAEILCSYCCQNNTKCYVSNKNGHYRPYPTRETAQYLFVSNGKRMVFISYIALAGYIGLLLIVYIICCYIDNKIKTY